MCSLDKLSSKGSLTPADWKGKPWGITFSDGSDNLWSCDVDRETVLGAIQRESYGYQTFFSNRVGEIQKPGAVHD